MKILELNGFKYSKVPFEGYTHLARVRLTTVQNEHHMHIYTTDPYKESVQDMCIDRKSNEVTSLSVVSWSTKEDNDNLTKFMLDF